MGYSNITVFLRKEWLSTIIILIMFILLGLLTYVNWNGLPGSEPGSYILDPINLPKKSDSILWGLYNERL